MKLAVYGNKPHILTGETHTEKVTALDVTAASGGQFTTMYDILDQWDDFLKWYKNHPPEQFVSNQTVSLIVSQLEAPISYPHQIFAIGMNYKKHANEIGLELPKSLSVFTKFSSSIGAPYCTVKLPSAATDWEMELVVVIKQPVLNGKKIIGRNILRENALDFVAAYTIGQDLSDRTLQFACNPAQFSLGKSHKNFAPIGPWFTSAGEVSNPQNLTLECRKNDEIMQSSNTKYMVFSIAELISRLSQTVELLAGDLIFTGTPEGVGQGRKPPVFLQSGDILTSTIQGLGVIRQKFV